MTFVAEGWYALYGGLSQAYVVEAAELESVISDTVIEAPFTLSN